MMTLPRITYCITAIPDPGLAGALRLRIDYWIIVGFIVSFIAYFGISRNQKPQGTQFVMRTSDMGWNSDMARGRGT